jgi:potassium uptake Trk family protein
MTIFASILIYATGKGQLSYIDSLLFASGGNTQAGLNPVDLNLLNTFQQVVVYLCPIASNPITIHTSVVFLRLYWFEKRFQGIAREARHRRTSISKSKSKSGGDLSQAERGVNGRNITVLHSSGKGPRMTNDGILLQGNDGAKNDASSLDKANGARLDSGDRGGDLTDSGTLAGPSQTDSATLAMPSQPEIEPAPTQGITFADTVTRSDGMGTEFTKFPTQQSNGDEMTYLKRQQETKDTEVLRIPGPRDAERGMGPKRLEEGDAPEEDREALDADDSGMTDRQNRSIAFKEPNRVRSPDRRKREELGDEVKAIKNTFGPLKFRKPRLFNKTDKKVHVEDDSPQRPRPIRARTMETVRSALSREKNQDMPYLSWHPTMGRNSQFPGLTLEQREELGGIEYRSLRTLAVILVCYFWGFELFALACLLPFIQHNDKYGVAVDAAGVSRTWWGFFTANSAFNDLGFTLTPDSMGSFTKSSYTLMIMWFLILIGNTGFPVMLRFIIWLLSLVIPKGTGFWEELRFLLDHPRRCFTLLFPSGATWWLFWILVGLNGLDLIFFVTLDVSFTTITLHLPPFSLSQTTNV